jgi:four helix bundle protein
MTQEKDNKGYRKLSVWQKADELAMEIYKETKNFPKDEIYGLTSQLRRAALSIPVNIVEGMGRQGRNELRQFVNIALGSHAETEYLLEFSKKCGYITEDKYMALENLRVQVGSLLWCFYKSLVKM